MANEQNIIPHRFTSEQNRDEAAKNGRKGGKASGEARRAKKIAKQVLSFKPDLPPNVLETMYRMGMKGTAKPDMRTVCTMAILQRAMKGDVKAYKFICELAGETADAELTEVKTEAIRNGGVEEWKIAEEAAERNDAMMTYADIFKTPAPTRTIEEIERGGDDV